MFCRKAFGVVQTLRDVFSKRRLGEGVSATAGIEKDIALFSPLKSPPAEKVLRGGIRHQVRQDTPQVLRQNIQIFTALKEKIKVFQVVRPDESPNRSNLLPLLVVLLLYIPNEKMKR